MTRDMDRIVFDDRAEIVYVLDILNNFVSTHRYDKLDFARQMVKLLNQMYLEW